MSSTKSHTAFTQQSSSLSSFHDFSGGASSNNHKKKFGKNLNQQHKQPAPPITVGVTAAGASRSSTSSSTSRSGLLLLSTTKKSSSGSGLLGSKLSSIARSAIAAGTGAASLTRATASGSKVGSNLSGVSSSSANDALLDAAAAEAAGDYGNQKQRETTQLAWGLQEKLLDQKKSMGGPPPLENEVSRVNGVGSGSVLVGGGSAVSPSQQPKRMVVTDLYSDEGTGGGHTREDFSTNDTIHKIEKDPDREPVTPPSASESNGELFNARRFSSNDSNTIKPDTTTVDNNKNTPPEGGQEVYMAKLAREAAEKRRREEETRAKDQKERAAQRLRELEKKTGKSSALKAGGGLVASTSLIHLSESTRWRQHSSGPSSEVVLERLGSTKGGGKIRSLSGGDNMADVKRAPRKLFDPNRSYSSLVGGTKASKSDFTSDDLAAHSKNTEDPKKETGASIPVPETEVSSSTFRLHQESIPASSSMIQLSSYEDRDRGGRKTSAGPRMLFDHKSGSMVVAPRREENGAFGKGRKDKAKTKTRNGKERDESTVSQVSSKRSASSNAAFGRPSDDSGTPDESTDTKYAKFRNARRDDVTARKEKKRVDKDKKFADGLRSSAFENGHKTRTRSTGSKIEGTLSHQQRLRIPRTKGVLYKRDEYGHLVSADKCEGDQGYGAHSVPGGRLRNVKAFNSFLKRQARNALAPVDGDAPAYFAAHQQQVYPQVVPNVVVPDYENNGLRSTPGLNRSHFMKTQSPQTPPIQAMQTPEKDLDIPSPLRVKPNEKIELLTGVEDSPTLQATAAAWAPSVAALAAAAAAISADNSGIEVNSHDSDAMSEAEVHRSAMSFIDHDIDSEESASVSLKYGLGFDPMVNMDSVIMTPATGCGDKPEGIHLPDLALDTCHVAAEERALSNPFGGLGPSLGCPTWGAGSSNMPMGPLSNWDLLGSGSKQSLDVSGSTSEQNECTPASFLSLGNLNGNQNTWGSGGLVSGFTTLAGTPLGSVEHPLSIDKD